MRRLATLALVASGAALAAPSGPPAPVGAIAGVWRGTSICVDRTLHPACRDEAIVYEFRPLADRDDIVRLDARKVVDGRPETTYLLDFSFDPAREAWVAEFRLPHAHGEWSYVVRGASLQGRLVDLPSGALVRVIQARKD